MNIAKTKVMVVDNTPINVNNVVIANVEGYVYTLDNNTAPRKITRTKRYNEKSRQAGRHTPNTGIYPKVTLPEDTGVQLLCAASYGIWCRVGSCTGRAGPARSPWAGPGQASMIFCGPGGVRA